MRPRSARHWRDCGERVCCACVGHRTQRNVRGAPAARDNSRASLGFQRPPLAGVIIAGAWALLLVSLPPDAPELWGLNAFRALAIGSRAALIAVAAATSLLVLRGARRVSGALPA